MNTRYQKFKYAFTLIEVMVSVMIISVVIMAMIKMYGDNTHMFKSLKKQTKSNEYASFILSNDKYGFEDKTVSLYDLVDDFNFEDDLRRKLKNIKVKLIYQGLNTVSLGEEQTEDEEPDNLSVSFEIGKSVIKTQDFSMALMRIKIK